MVCHLADACRMATGHIVVAPVAGPLPPPLMKYIALYLPLPWPRGIPTVPELDHHRGGGTAPVDFDADRAAAEALLDSLPGRDTWPPHPIFGRMSRRDWLRWGYVHTAHHLTQFGA